MKLSEIKELAESGLNHSVPPFPTLAQYQELAEATLKLCELVEEMNKCGLYTGAYLEAVEKYSALSLKYSDLVDNFSVQKQELNHKTEIVCGEENKTITVAWAYVERRAYDELKLENERLRSENEKFNLKSVPTLPQAREAQMTPDDINELQTKGL